MTKQNLLNFTYKELQAFLVEKGLKPFVTEQIFSWIYRKKNFVFEEWSNVSKVNQEFLKENFEIKMPRIIWAGESVDGTAKFLMRLEDKNTVETVLIPAKERMTICLSSQVGCAIGCTFCHTGTQGLTRNLELGEITGQLLVASLWLEENRENQKITNMVYMGQGEPLHNFTNTKKSIENFMDVKGLGYGQRKITLSTSGLVPQIEKLSDFPPINIAISLHASHDHIRSELMPINQRYDLEKLFSAIKKIPLKAHRRITYEYILIDGLNDSMKDINGLKKLLNRKESKVNIIPFNPYPGSDFKRPSKEKIKWFNDTLNSIGFTSTVRATKGDDILAACGQLKSQAEENPTSIGLATH